jgi:hypothetical protein
MATGHGMTHAHFPSHPGVTAGRVLLLGSALASFGVCAVLLLSSPQPASGPQSGTPEALLSALSPPGSLRISRRSGAQGDGDHILILQDARVPALDVELAARLLSASTGFDPQAGDVMTLERAVFAGPAHSTLPAPPTLISALALFAGGLASLFGMILVMPRAAPAVSAPLPADTHPRPGPELHTLPANDLPAQGSDLAMRDPETAARVIRLWLREDRNPTG